MVAWLLNLMKPSAERRRSTRVSGLQLVACYFDGSSASVYPLRDISEEGAYIETAWPWAPGTLMRFTLNKAANVKPNGTSTNGVSGNGSHGSDSIMVHAEVVRTLKNGMAVHFVFPSFEERRRFLAFFAKATAPQASSAEHGQSLIEFSLIFPLLFLLIVNVVNFGTFMYDWITVANAARAGAQYMITGGATVFAPSTPTTPQVSTLVTNDISSLPNKSSLVVKWCTNNNGTVAGTTTCSADPEAPSYTLGVIDVTYTYQPMIPLWSFPGLKVNATIPNTTIHRKTVMRILI